MTPDARADNGPLPNEYSDRERLHTEVAVSVLVPTYRQEGLIAQTLAGILAQKTEFPLEIIVGEDGSPDGTRAILLDLQARHPDVLRVLSFPQNVGPHRNMAALIAASRAPLIAHCDGDDLWTDTEKLTKQWRVFAERPSTALVFHAAGTIDGEGNRLPTKIRRGWFSRRMTLQEVVLGDGGLMPTSSMLVRRSAMLDEPSWQSAAPVGDYPLGIRAGMLGDVVYIDQQMCDYRMSVPHSWTSRHVPSFDSRLTYARQIDRMLEGVVADRADCTAAARAVVSKYYSDVLVRYAAGDARDREVYDELRDRMLGSEKLLAWLAACHNLRLPALKNLLRKAATFVRLLVGHAPGRRILIGASQEHA